jgi:hypothetical protein
MVCICSIFVLRDTVDPHRTERLWRHSSLVLGGVLLLQRAMQFAIAGGIFVFGVFGPELIGSFHNGVVGGSGGLLCRESLNCGFGSSVMVALEEGMELLGVTIFANALLHICLAACPKLTAAMEKA